MTLSRSLGILLATLPLAALAQTTPAAPAAAPVPAAAPATPADNLDLRFANGIVAVVNNKIITVDDLRREIAPRIDALQRTATSQEDFDNKMEALQDQVVRQLIDRILIVQDFKKDDKRHIPESYIDNVIADEQVRRFDGDRAKFLAYLRALGMSYLDYRQKVEDDIIYDYMIGQQRKNDDIVSPVRVEDYYNAHKETFYQEAQVHMLMIALNRNPAETDAALLARADKVEARVKAGEKFADLAREVSQGAKSESGGDWGWQHKSDLKPEFSEPLFKLSKGQATAPILTAQAAYILYAEDTKPAGLQPIDDVRVQIDKILATQMAGASEARWIGRLRRDAYIRIY